MWGWFSCASSQVRSESQRRGCSVRWCFLQFGKTYAATKRKLGIPKNLVDLSVLSFCCRELICDSQVRASRACPGRPPDNNQSITCKSLRFDLRLSESRFTSDRKHSTNAVPQQGFGHWQHFPRSNRGRYARTHTCSPWPVLEYVAPTHASRRTIFICWAFSSMQVPSDMIILTLQRQESS